ncbi:MAG: MurR/RpiR family transcriptional regulator [Chloroflexota bacterium]|nr:MurR/RpiR family transcriptional regulator [Chloroflexota bacterium]
MILEKIRKAYPHLTKSQKTLADFIASSYRDVAFMTASRLAEAVDLDEATVIRFAQRLGYPGYPELVEGIQELVRQELATPPIISQEPFLTALYAEIEELQRVAEHIPPKTAHKAVKMLQKAKSIYVIGQGAGAALAELFTLSLRSVGMKAYHTPGDVHKLFSVLDDLSPADLLVICATQTSTTIAKAVKYAGHKGTPTLALAWSPTAPCAQAADVSLSYALGDSRVAQPVALTATLIDALTGQLSTLNSEQVEAQKRRHAELEAFFANS